MNMAWSSLQFPGITTTPTTSSSSSGNGLFGGLFGGSSSSTANTVPMVFQGKTYAVPNAALPMFTQQLSPLQAANADPKAIENFQTTWKNLETDPNANSGFLSSLGGMEGISRGLSAIASLGQVWNAMQSLNLQKEAFEFQKDAWNKNYANHLADYNNAVARKANAYETFDPNRTITSRPTEAQYIQKYSIG